MPRGPCKRPIAERLWEKVEISSGCWIWLGTWTDKGYGQLCVNSKRTYTHRICWELFNGPIPDGLEVLHSCDNPPCVRPDHLFLGTHQENMRDAKAKGRMSHGKLHAMAGKPMHGIQVKTSKLKESEIVEIRRLSRQGLAKKAIARLYGVCPPNISKIVSGRLWGHIPF